MRIKNVQATTHRLPIHIPLIEKDLYSQVVFVRIETDEGICGHGLTAGKSQRFGVREFIVDELQQRAGALSQG